MDTDRFSHPTNSLAAISRRAALGHLAAGGVAAALLTATGRTVALAQATPEAGDEGEAMPNDFVLAGPETRITYLSANDAGDPVLTYDGPFGGMTWPAAAEESALGRLITGYLGAFPDMGEFWLTLLLPRFNPLPVGAAPVPFTTLAIVSGLVSSIVGPPGTVTPWRFQVVPLEGTARSIVP